MSSSGLDVPARVSGMVALGDLDPAELAEEAARPSAGELLGEAPPEDDLDAAGRLAAALHGGGGVGPGRGTEHRGDPHGLLRRVEAELGD